MDQHAFVAHILASPSDDGPRLVFADWLEERGDPRAEVLRALHDPMSERSRSLIGSWKAGWDRADEATIPEDLPAAIAPLAATMNMRLVLPMVTPAWDRIKTCSDGWRAARVAEVIQHTLAVSELVALGFLPRDAAGAARDAAGGFRDAAWNSLNAAGVVRDASWYALNAAGSASRAALYALEAALSTSRVAWYASNAVWYAIRAAGPAHHDAFQARNATSSAAAALFGSAQWAELAQLLVPVAA